MRALFALALIVAASTPAWAAPAVYGFNFPTWWEDTYASPRTAESLRLLAGTGARWIALTPTWFARSTRDSRIAPTRSTPTDESLRAVIREARALGLEVAMKPHVDIEGGPARALLRPADTQAWFADYRRFIAHYAALAKDEGCGLFVVGTELFMTSGPLHKREWERVIGEVRQAYPGRLTYAANWYDVASVGFWPSLDFIGVDAYYPVPGRDRSEMAAGWRTYRAVLAALSRLHGRPVLVTEVGLASQKGANLRPWSYGDFGPLDLKVQADYLGAFLDAFQGVDWFAGFLEWAWEVEPGAGGPADKSMTVQGKPAEGVLRGYFARQRPRALGPQVAEAAGRMLRLIGPAAPNSLRERRHSGAGPR